MGMAFPHCDVNDLEGLLWTHVSLLSLCGILILASFNAQFRDPAPYGRHADPAKAKAWGFPIPQRVGHIASDAIPGLVLFPLMYLLYAGLVPPGGRFSEVCAINVVLLCGWLLHYLYRGIVHPLIMPYSSRTVAVGIPLAGGFPNILFSYLIAAQLACTVYPEGWASDPRFIIGVILYGIGTAINRWADLKLRAGRLAMKKRGREAQKVQPWGTVDGDDSCSTKAAVRESLLAAGSEGGASTTGRTVAPLEKPGPQEQSQEQGQGQGRPQMEKQQAQGLPEVRSHYFIPRGGLYELVSCPNYLGELVEWAGYALALWSWPGLAWALFGASTFIPRAITHHRWYKQHFGEEYPARRKALIPFVF